MFPGLNSAPITARISPDTCSAYASDARLHASMDDGSSKSHSGSTIFFLAIVDSKVTPSFSPAMWAAISAPPTPSVLPDQKNALLRSVLSCGLIFSISNHSAPPAVSPCALSAFSSADAFPPLSPAGLWLSTAPRSGLCRLLAAALRSP